jgi:amino acid permease
MIVLFISGGGKHMSDDEDEMAVWWLIPGEESELIDPVHIALTTFLWALTTFLAIKAPSLGDVLDLVGCATGTVIAFILPAMFSFKLHGYSHLALAFLVVGASVGLIGTFFSLVELVKDSA